MPVGELKTHFSEVIDEVKAGEEIVITYGKKRERCRRRTITKTRSIGF